MDKIKVLLVEDDMAIQLHIRNFLLKNACDVSIANNGEEAIDNYLSHKIHFDAIIVDILMPKLNGLELLLYARKKGYEETKIIGMTSGFSSYLGSLSPEKFDLLLTKPLDLDHLLGIIRNN